ncbi:MAG: FecR domain-containing protein [Acetobacteraceae bacterium]|nr:FecR domain-containing protein [Acetobacteraceae bacterium]
MRYVRRHLMLLIALAASPSARADRPRVGEVSSITGAATALFPSDPPRPLSPASPVLIEDVLATEASARLACRLDGGLELRLGGGARLRIDAAVLRGPQAGIALRDLGVGGPLLIDRPPSPAAPPIAVSLPWARIGVRGTRVWVGVVDGLGAVFVARGRATVEAIGTRVTLTEGEGVDIPLQPFGPPDLTVRRWGQARIDRALRLVE